MKFNDLVKVLGADVLDCYAAADPDIQGVSVIDESPPGTLSFIEGQKFANHIATSQASALILPADEKIQTQATARGMAWVSTTEPRLLFAKAIALFYRPYSPPVGVDPSAVIEPTVRLGEGISIGAHVVVRAGSVIGDGVCIHPNVVVYPGVTVGDRTVLHANCVIHENTQIGADCVIHSGAAIGSEGFGFVPTPGGWVKMLQSGRVVLEDGVEVGCNAAVDRPAAGETRIGRNTKIDNLVQVGHGTRTGHNCLMAGQSGIAGSSRLGNWVILAGQSGLTNQVNMGDRAIATAKAGVHNDVSPGEIVTGVPAIPHKLFLKAAAVYSRLPEMYQTLRRLQQQMGGSK